MLASRRPQAAAGCGDRPPETSRASEQKAERRRHALSRSDQTNRRAGSGAGAPSSRTWGGTSTSARRTRRQAQAWQAAPELQSEARKALTAVRNCISRDCQVNTPADRGGCGCRDREAACAQHFSEYVPGRYLHRGRLQIVAISSADDGVQFRGQKQSTGDNPRRRFISSVE